MACSLPRGTRQTGNKCPIKFQQRKRRQGVNNRPSDSLDDNLSTWLSLLVDWFVVHHTKTPFGFSNHRASANFNLEGKWGYKCCTFASPYRNSWLDAPRASVVAKSPPLWENGGILAIQSSPYSSWWKWHDLRYEFCSLFSSKTRIDKTTSGAKAKFSTSLAWSYRK
jgi:hypothetical protein